MAVISATVYQQKDDAGNPRVEGWFLYEFQATYVPGGIAADLSSYMRRVEGMMCNPASGALNYIPFPNEVDFPADARSGRVQMFFMGSGEVTVNTSGVGISLASGWQGFVSGQLISGNISGTVLGILVSGRITAQATAWDPNRAFAEVISGQAVSGTRARLFVMGY